MRTWIKGPALAALAAASLGALTWCWGQPTPPTGPAATVPLKPVAAAPAGVDPAKLPMAQQMLYASAKDGKDWLLRMNRPNGRFLYGFVPSLRVALTEDNYLHQTAAAFALARCARFFKEEQSAAVARQALLTLLLETDKDAKNPQVRSPLAGGVNPIAAASWLVLAINELPAPGADLLQQSEELCQFLRGRQQQDGSFAMTTATSDLKANATDPAAATAPGLALYALTRSLQHRQEPWKLEAARKGREYYQAQWRTSKDVAAASWLSAACSEAFLLTREQSFAQFANELNDWLCTLQYKEVQPQRPLWHGGFKKWSDGQLHTTAPDVHTAVSMEGLAQGARLAKERGDLPRFQAYRQALELCGQFLLTLQYTSANSQHFEVKYRHDFLLGGFHPTHQDGLLRIDFTQEAVCGLVKYLADVAEVR